MVAERLPGIHKVLGSSPKTTKKGEKREKGRKKRREIILSPGFRIPD